MIIKSSRRYQSVARAAAGQWGLVTRAQAQRLGATSRDLARWCRRGLMDREATDVYRIVGAPDDLGLDGLRVPWLQTESTLWSYERELPAVVSHLSAAHTVYGFGVASPNTNHLTTAYPIAAPLEVTQLHIDATLGRDDWKWIDGLPVTTVGRTVADLYAYGIDGDHLGRIIWDALRSGIAAHSLAMALDRVSSGRGRSVLDASLRDCGASQYLAHASDRLDLG